MSENPLPKVTIYTDGGCNPNPGPGGWAAILLFPGESPRELCSGAPETTNNQMELQAAIEALGALSEAHEVELLTDSTYVRQGITEWLPRWEANGWRRKKDALANVEQWQQLASLVKTHKIDWHWVKGHAGNRWNERADELASSMIPRPKLPLDDENAIHIFAASSYSGKTKTGGWAVALRYRERQKTLTGQVKNTSSNRLHVQAAVEGLQALKQSLPIHLYTTSDYLKDGATQWIGAWQARNWQTKQGKAVSHRDLWEKIANFNQRYQIQWHVVNKEEMPPEMEQAKQLAGEASRGE